MNLNKRCFSFLLSLLLILSSVNLSFAQKTAFTDVPDNHWASNVIGKWSGERYNVLKGDGKGNFHPNKGLTLGEFTTILSKTFGYTQRVSAEVTPMWAKDPIEKAIAAGILPKTDTVNANQIVTRQQAIKYIALAFSIQAEEGETLFADNKDISKEYKPYVKAFQEMGYVGGDNKDISKAKFNPQANYTRAEAMQVIDNTISDIIDKQTKDKTYPKNIIIRKENTTLENIKTKESLIIGQGAKDSKINIDKVEIGKSLIIYGGEEITVNNDNPIKNTIVNKPYKKDITLKGKFNTITVHDKTTLHIIGEAEKIILLGSAKATLNGKEVQSSTTENKKTNSNTGGTGSGGSGSGGNNPSIIVTTPFPIGKTENNAIDVKYTATPSKGATIKQVSYIINDDLEEYIYLSGGDGINQKGTLGTGRVLLLPGENKVVFKVIDSSGKSATFDVKERPDYQWGTHTPNIEADEISEFMDGSGTLYVNNRVVIYAKKNVSKQKIEDIVLGINGKIIGYANAIRIYTVQVQKNNEQGLQKICNDLIAQYPNEIKDAFLETIEESETDSNSTQRQNPTNDPWWTNREWGLRSIQVPAAWNHIQNNNANLRDLRIGIIDNGVRRTHSDLNIPRNNVFNRTINVPNDNDHGTHVIGIIAAIQNNNLGIAGIKDTSRNNIFAYDSHNGINRERSGTTTSDREQLIGLTWNVVRGAKVINVSIGSRNPPRRQNRRFEIVMQELIDDGYDFIIVRSAGNGSRDTMTNGSFSHVRDEQLLRRIISVAASNRNEELADFSNHGVGVTVAAPGVDIWSTGASNDVHYYSSDGTSMSAPHVAGVAAMVWSVNPALSGEQVKDIIVRSANVNGLRIRDPRHNNNNINFPVATYRQVNALAAVQLAMGEEPEHEKGRLAGLIVKADKNGDNNNLNNPISNATITLYKKSKDPQKPTGEKVKSVKSESNGHYRINDIAPGDYYFTVEAPKCVTETVHVTIEPGVTTNIHKLRAVTETKKKGKSKGKVKNSITGSAVADAITLEFRRGIDPDLSEEAEVIQSENGRYNIELQAGNYTVTAKADGYITSTSYIISYGNDIVSEDQDITISPKLQQGTSSFRAVLTWGKDPRDLDSHLVGPTPDGNKFHIYFANKNYHYQGELYNNLDVDDPSSYGPETVTMNKLVDGTYDYYVHDFTNRTVTTSTQLSLSEARIQLYDSQGNTVRTFNVPSTSGVGTIWHVFTLIVKDGKYTIIPVDKLSNKIIRPEYIGTRGFRSANTNRNIDLFNFALTQEEKDAKIKARQQDGVQGDNLDLELNKQDQKIEELNQGNTSNPDNSKNPNNPNNSNDTTPTQEDVSIKILSIPTGKVDKDIIDITYLAIPSDKATINQISYTINDQSEQVIYKLKDNKTIGELGKAQIKLMQGENNIKFKVIDTSGKTIVYELPEKLYYR